MSALSYRLHKSGVPAPDFGVFGPFGAREALFRKFEDSTMVDGVWQKRIVRGPATYEAWLASWRVFRCACLHLGVASLASLEEYESGMEVLVKLYPNAWGHLYISDTMMRTEQWRTLMLNISIGLHKPKSEFEAARPWDYVIRATSYGSEEGVYRHWWETRVVLPLS